MLTCPMCSEKIMVPGKVDNFLLHGHLGEGEMGTIYLATDESLNREVAVKVVRGCHADDPAQRERLHREACAAGTLNHPRVAQVYALNFSNGHPYLVMELVTGLDFSQRLESEGRIEESEVLRMALDVADGLSALHREGLVHGDIKPANIVLDRDGNAKLVDFGLSDMMRHDGHGNLVGTPHYLAPEILKGVPDSHRSDLYSLGGTLYYLLCGKLPFKGETQAEMLKARLDQDPIPLETYAPEVSLLTRRMVMRLLERDPSKRYINSDALADDISEALNNLASSDSNTSDLPDLSARSNAIRTQRLGPRSQPQPQTEPPPPQRNVGRHVYTLLLLLVAVIELAVAFKQNSFPQTWKWLSTDVPNWITSNVSSFMENEAQAEGTDLPGIRGGAEIPWRSSVLGEFARRGSTMQSGGLLIVNSTGKDMWMGEDNCRFVWTSIAANYVFSAKVLESSTIKSHDVSGLMIKGENPAHGPGVLFGFLGSGELFLQIRHPFKAVEVIRCSGGLIKAPAYLRICRSENTFDAGYSSDGKEWLQFAKCELDLPETNSVGVIVAAEHPQILATAKFSDIILEDLHLFAPVPSNTVERVQEPVAELTPPS